MTYRPGQPYGGRSNRWQDWATLILAIWLFISPWVLQFGGGVSTTPVTAAPGGGPIAAVSNAAWNAWVLGVIVFILPFPAQGESAGIARVGRIITGYKPLYRITQGFMLVACKFTLQKRFDAAVFL